MSLMSAGAWIFSCRASLRVLPHFRGLDVKAATLQTHGKDKYRRTIADVLPQDGSNINHMLGKDGWR
jgi:endonuclease YncB( thermonuclease family)